MVIGGDVELALPVPHDDRERIRLDHQALGQPLGFLFGLGGGHLIGIADGDEVWHFAPPFDTLDAPVMAVQQARRQTTSSATGEIPAGSFQPPPRVW